MRIRTAVAATGAVGLLSLGLLVPAVAQDDATEGPAPATADRAARHEAFSEALADELDLDVDTVTEAVDALRTEMQEGRSEMHAERSEMHAERSEMHAEHHAGRAEMHAERHAGREGGPMHRGEGAGRMGGDGPGAGGGHGGHHRGAGPGPGSMAPDAP
jgi:hypothetical protein